MLLARRLIRCTWHSTFVSHAFLLVTAFLLAASGSAVAQTVITTVAGNGVATFGGDGGPATAARLYVPMGLAFDAAGNLFVADTSSHRIRRVDSVTGIITTVAGNGSFGFSGDGGPATAAQLSHPEDLAITQDGRYLLADMSNHASGKPAPQTRRLSLTRVRRSLSSRLETAWR